MAATDVLRALRCLLDWRLMLLAVIVVNTALASESCADFSARAAADWGEPANCYCGASLSKVQATLPGSLKVAAACKMYRDHGVSGRIELSPQRDLLDLDRYDNHGNAPYGVVFLRGQLTLDGVIRYSNGMDEIVSFYAMQLVKEDGGVSVLANSHIYRGISFTPAQVAELKAPDMSKDTLCAERKATVRFTDLDIKIIDTDEAGATPQHIKVLKLGPLMTCSE